jgi:hypothetical protein
MANRFPLIVDSSSQQLKELPASDNIDLTNSGIVKATSIGSTTITASTSVGVNTDPEHVPTNLYVLGTAAGSVVSLGTTDANTTLDLSTSNNFAITLGASITLNNPTGLQTGQSGIIMMTQDGTGSRTVAYGSNWKFPASTAPTLTTAGGSLDVLTYFVNSPTSIVANSILNLGS